MRLKLLPLAIAVALGVDNGRRLTFNQADFAARQLFDRLNGGNNDA